MVLFLKKLKNGLFFLFLLSVLLAFNAPRVSILVVVAMLVHEGGHALVLLLLGKSVRGIRFGAVGAKMSYSGRLSYREECLVCIAGPVANLLVGGLVFLCLHNKNEYFCLFSYVNFFYALTNLLPLPSYDGEKILRILTFHLPYPKVAEHILSLISLLLRCVLLFLSLYLIFYFDIAYQIFGCIFFSLLPDFAKEHFSSKK